MAEHVVCVCIQLGIVENSCICLDKVTYICILLHKTTYGSIIMNMDAYYDWTLCINSDMIENTFLWSILHAALCSFVACYIILHRTVVYDCILVHIVTYRYTLFQNALYRWTWLRKVFYCCGWLHMCKYSHIVANWCK